TTRSLTCLFDQLTLDSYNHPVVLSRQRIHVRSEPADTDRQMALTAQGARCPASSCGTAGLSGSIPASSLRRSVPPAPSEFSSMSPECAPVQPLPVSAASRCRWREQVATAH